MIPVKNEVDKTGFPAVTFLLILFCILIFFLRKSFDHGYAVVPLEFMHSVFNPGEELSTSLKALFTAFFMHGSFFHLLSNMWFLWIFGSAMEMQLGRIRFFSVYILSGCVSLLIQVISSPLSSIPIVGASGAIAGLMGVHLIFLPLSRILVFIPPVFLFRIPALLYLLFWFYIQYLNLLQPQTENSGVAWWAHAGGYVFGVTTALILKMAGTEGKVRKRKKM
ncbi:MAG: rhomboid family intramembrane serine protease [Chitinispirillaceae bacterium]